MSGLKSFCLLISWAFCPIRTFTLLPINLVPHIRLVSETMHDLNEIRVYMYVYCICTGHPSYSFICPIFICLTFCVQELRWYGIGNNNNNATLGFLDHSYEFLVGIQTIGRITDIDLECATQIISQSIIMKQYLACIGIILNSII